MSQTTDFHFANYRFPFRKLQIFISQTTDFHFVSFHFVSQTSVSPLKGIFLVRKWINNTLKSNSVRYHMHHQKNLSSFCLVLGCARFLHRVPNNRICQHCDVKMSMVTPTFYYFFIIFLTCYISVPSLTYNLCYFLLLGNHLKGLTVSKLY